MTEESVSGNATSDLIETSEKVNSLLHELETMVSPEQHKAITELLAEWSVLSAMRTTLALQNTTNVKIEDLEFSDENAKGE